MTPQPQRSAQIAFALGHTDAWHGDRLKEVRGGDHGGRIRGEAGRELWMRRRTSLARPKGVSTRYAAVVGHTWILATGPIGHRKSRSDTIFDPGGFGASTTGSFLRDAYSLNAESDIGVTLHSDAVRPISRA